MKNMAAIDEIKQEKMILKCFKIISSNLPCLEMTCKQYLQ